MVDFVLNNFPNLWIFIFNFLVLELRLKLTFNRRLVFFNLIIMFINRFLDQIPKINEANGLELVIVNSNEIFVLLLTNNQVLYHHSCVILPVKVRQLYLFRSKKLLYCQFFGLLWQRMDLFALNWRSLLILELNLWFDFYHIGYHKYRYPQLGSLIAYHT